MIRRYWRLRPKIDSPLFPFTFNSNHGSISFGFRDVDDVFLRHLRHFGHFWWTHDHAGRHHAQTCITQVYLQTTPCLPFLRKRSPDGATPNSGRTLIGNPMLEVEPACINQIQDGGRPPFWKIEKGHISATVWPIATKFNTLMHIDHMNHIGS